MKNKPTQKTTHRTTHRVETTHYYTLFKACNTKKQLKQTQLDYDLTFY